MKQLIVVLILFSAYFGFAQEIEEEFLPITLEDKEAFMSTKTGEYVFRAHADTNPEELKTTSSGVVYNDISTHKVVKGETLSSIAKKHKLDLTQLKKDNKLKSNKLSLGQELKIVNRILVPSSSPVISYAGEERIIAKLRPGQSPSTLAPPPPDATPVALSTPEKTQSPDVKKPVSRKSTYYKPMVVPNKTDQPEKEVEVVKEEIEEDIKQESKEVIEAQRQLEEAQRKLQLAKQKALIEEASKKLKIEEKELEKELEESEEVKREEEKVKAKYDAIQEKFDKVKSTSNTELEEKKESNAKVIEEKQIPETEVKEEVEGVDYHIIVKGDNLYNLARTYKTTIKKLTELNNVKFNNLKIGQKLKLK